MKLFVRSFVDWAITRMRAFMDVMSQSDYDSWLKQQSGD